MKELIDQFEELSAGFLVDAKCQNERGNKAAGRRARNSALKLMSLLKEFRKASNEKTKE